KKINCNDLVTKVCKENKLNEEQSSAIDRCLKFPITMIHGPPGTGKTKTGAAIFQVAFFVCLGVVKFEKKKKNKKTTGDNTSNYTLMNKIFACAHTHHACDQLLEYLDKLQLPQDIFEITRVGPVHKLNRNILRYSLDYKMSKEWEKTKMGRGQKKPDAMWKKEFTAKILTKSSVIVGTCYAATHLLGHEFDVIIMDEVTQIYEPLSLLAINLLGTLDKKNSSGLGQKHLILIGDPMQLQPIVKSSKHKMENSYFSLFENLVYSGITNVDVNNEHYSKKKEIKYKAHFALSLPNYVLLKTQYRMRPCLSAFSNAIFYSSLLKNDPSVIDDDNPKYQQIASILNQLETNFSLVNNHKYEVMKFDSILLISCNQSEMESNEMHGIDSTRTSKYNICETQVIADHILPLVFNSGVQNDDIGIITPYRAQVRALKIAIEHSTQNDWVHVGTVDSFQGKEKDLIILSLVISENGLNLFSTNFIDHSRRMNVSLTRAKYGLIVVSNRDTLTSCTLWKQWLAQYNFLKR
ncbi:DNA2/NAM7 helicase family transcriptional regulator, partial [Reticulomyxa filosa]